MGYRTEDPKPRPHARRTMADLSTPSGIFVNQGVLAHFAIPCWYQEVHKPIPAQPHDKPLHDHLGWPQPTRPDHSCQLWTVGCHRPPYIGIDLRNIWPYKYMNLDNLFPIHLTEEGYGSVDLYIDGELQESGANQAWIDDQDDWVVRATLLFDHCDSGKPEPHDIAIFATIPGSDGEAPLRRDVVVHSRVTVLPILALPHSEDQEENL